MSEMACDDGNETVPGSAFVSSRLSVSASTLQPYHDGCMKGGRHHLILRTGLLQGRAAFDKS